MRMSPAQPPAACQSAGKPWRYAFSAPPSSEPEPIQLESSVKDEGRQRAAGDEVVRLGFDLGHAGERDAQQGDDDEAEDEGVKVHGGCG